MTFPNFNHQCSACTPNISSASHEIEYAHVIISHYKNSIHLYEEVDAMSMCLLLIIRRVGVGQEPDPPSLVETLEDLAGSQYLSRKVLPSRQDS